MNDHATTREFWGNATVNLILDRYDNDLSCAVQSVREGLLTRAEFCDLAQHFTVLAETRLDRVASIWPAPSMEGTT